MVICMTTRTMYVWEEWHNKNRPHCGLFFFIINFLFQRGCRGK